LKPEHEPNKKEIFAVKPDQRTPVEIEELRREIARFPTWYHNIDLGDGVWTCPNQPRGDHPGDRWRMFAPYVPEDCSGMSVLDIGCNAGYFCLEFKKRKASYVLGIEPVPLHLEQARFAARALGFTDIDYRCVQAYDLDQLVDIPAKFDFVVFTGLLYHLRHPLLMLDILSRRVGRRMLFQTVIHGRGRDMEVPADLPFDPLNPIFDDPRFPAMTFIEGSLSGDASDWWLVNEAGAKALLRSAGFTHFAQLANRECFVCDAPEGQARVHEPLPLFRRTDCLAALAAPRCA
jgi:tRNA (mo5U34)-methyltransferase